MLRGSREDGTRWRPLFAAAAFLLVAGLMSTGPASAHTFTKTDGNDSPGKLDIRSASVNHGNNKVVHTVRTFEGWTPKTLGNDSFFIIEIDKNFDDDFEQCAFIFFAGGRLRGSLTNCRRTFIRSLSVSKPSKAVASISVPTANTGKAYRWVAFSFWTGLPARCSDLCFDAAPNRPPPILHDLTLPVIGMNNDFLAVWIESTTPDFVLPFTVTDAHTGVEWTLQNRVFGSTTWTTVSTGTTEGLHEPSFTNVAAGDYEYRVVATDSQGNHRDGPIREVMVPIDVDIDIGPGVFVGGVDTPDTDAYGGSYVALNERDDTYTIVYDHPGGPCRNFFVVGSGFGDWQVRVTDQVGGQVDIVNGTNVQDLARATVYSESICADATRVFTVNTDVAGFRVDAVVI